MREETSVPIKINVIHLNVHVSIMKIKNIYNQMAKLKLLPKYLV